MKSTNGGFVIEQNVPLPDKRSGRHSRYPLRAMNVGESFFVPTEFAERAKVASAVSYFSARNPGYKFTTSKCDGGIRVWRIEA